MPWLILFIAGLFEVVWAVGIKYTEGWTRLWPAVITVAAMIASFYLLSLALKNIPMGTAYAVWTGIGTIGTVLYGILFFKEPTDILRIVCILLIISGIIGLRILAK
jgi:quaternary ammonium compound-resistance protein SugE